MALEIVTQDANALEVLRRGRIRYMSIPIKDNVYMFMRPKASAKVVYEALEVARETGSHFIVRQYGKAPSVYVDGEWRTASA